MIRFIEGRHLEAADRQLIEAMHLNRAECFSHRHGWDVKVTDGLEIDKFDFDSPLYVISVDSQANYRGSLRLLPTTGPNMLRDVFPQLLLHHEQGCAPCYSTVESATIWECSRICVKPGTGPDGLRELLIGIGEVCEIAGLTQVVSVFDARMYRILRTMMRIELIGTPQKIGEVMCYAALFSFDRGALDAFRERYGFGSVTENANVV